MIRMGPFYLGIVHESVIFQHALLMLAEASEDRQAALKAFVVCCFNGNTKEAGRVGLCSSCQGDTEDAPTELRSSLRCDAQHKAAATPCG